jgi:hypothetical protein
MPGTSNTPKDRKIESPLTEQDMATIHWLIRTFEEQKLVKSSADREVSEVPAEKSSAEMAPEAQASQSRSRDRGRRLRTRHLIAVVLVAAAAATTMVAEISLALRGSSVSELMEPVASIAALAGIAIGTIFNRSGRG